MNVTLRKVGNSQAVIIPQGILLQLGLSNHLNMEIMEDKIILSKPQAVRAGWEDAAKQIAATEDDEILLDIPSENDEEWVW